MEDCRLGVRAAELNNKNSFSLNYVHLLTDLRKYAISHKLITVQLQYQWTAAYITNEQSDRNGRSLYKCFKGEGWEMERDLQKLIEPLNLVTERMMMPLWSNYVM